MASIVDAFNDAFVENHWFLKFFVYSLPVFASAFCFVKGNITTGYIIAAFTLILLFGLLTCGINNVRENRKEIITINPFYLLTSTIKCFFAIIPSVLICGFLGYIIITCIKLPEDYPYLPLIFDVVVVSILSSIVITSFLAFSKHLNIFAAYNVKNIFESCVDIFVSLLFFVPQLIIADCLIVGAVWYVLYVFKIPVENPLFILFCSMVVILNISVISNYFSQIAYEYIKGEDEEYADKYVIKGNRIDKID